jgi:hypothetical protein
MQELLRQRGLPDNGSRTTLATRLLQALEEDDVSGAPTRPFGPAWLEVEGGRHRQPFSRGLHGLQGLGLLRV